MLKSRKINLKGLDEDAQDPERCEDTRSDLVYENKQVSGFLKD